MTVVRCPFRFIVMVNTALKSGSSKQGKTNLASVGSIIVANTNLYHNVIIYFTKLGTKVSQEFTFTALLFKTNLL